MCTVVKLAKDKKLKGSIRTKMMKCAWSVKDREHILNQLFTSNTFAKLRAIQAVDTA